MRNASGQQALPKKTSSSARSRRMCDQIVHLLASLAFGNRSLQLISGSRDAQYLAMSEKLYRAIKSQASFFFFATFAQAGKAAKGAAFHDCSPMSLPLHQCEPISNFYRSELFMMNLKIGSLRHPCLDLLSKRPLTRLDHNLNEVAFQRFKGPGFQLFSGRHFEKEDCLNANPTRSRCFECNFLGKYDGKS